MHMTTVKRTGSTMAVGLALGVLAASATANAEVVGRYKYNGDNAWVYAVDGCNYFSLRACLKFLPG